MTKLNAYILLDRSGSMAGKWEETLSSVNAYVDELNKNKAEGYITLATFDDYAGPQYDVVRNQVAIHEYKPISVEEATPRGNTPLFDALYKTLAAAEVSNVERTVVIVMTDGEENSSKEISRDSLKKALDRVKARSWEVIFLGANFDAFTGAGQQLGIQLNKTFNNQPGLYSSNMRSLATMTSNYVATGAALDLDNTKATINGKS